MPPLLSLTSITSVPSDSQALCNGHPGYPTDKHLSVDPPHNTLDKNGETDQHPTVTVLHSSILTDSVHDTSVNVTKDVTQEGDTEHIAKVGTGNLQDSKDVNTSNLQTIHIVSQTSKLSDNGISSDKPQASVVGNNNDSVKDTVQEFVQTVDEDNVSTNTSITPDTAVNTEDSTVNIEDSAVNIEDHEQITDHNQSPIRIDLKSNEVNDDSDIAENSTDPVNGAFVIENLPVTHLPSNECFVSSNSSIVTADPPLPGDEVSLDDNTERSVSSDLSDTGDDVTSVREQENVNIKNAPYICAIKRWKVKK